MIQRMAAHRLCQSHHKNCRTPRKPPSQNLACTACRMAAGCKTSEMLRRKASQTADCTAFPESHRTALAPRLAGRRICHMSLHTADHIRQCTSQHRLHQTLLGTLPGNQPGSHLHTSPRTAEHDRCTGCRTRRTSRHNAHHTCPNRTWETIRQYRLLPCQGQGECLLSSRLAWSGKPSQGRQPGGPVSQACLERSPTERCKFRPFRSSCAGCCGCCTLPALTLRSCCGRLVGWPQTLTQQYNSARGTCSCETRSRTSCPTMNIRCQHLVTTALHMRQTAAGSAAGDECSGCGRCSNSVGAQGRRRGEHDVKARCHISASLGHMKGTACPALTNRPWVLFDVLEPCLSPSSGNSRCKRCGSTW
mmetsp:Transcript_4465/g.10376  ORF Transcript_4465/g.10376 Transcript_4465/m.10376 type:complete len:362 (+) Transcript_4465:326-1411(+)